MDSIKNFKWHHWAAVAGTAAATVGVMYYLLREDGEEKAVPPAAVPRGGVVSGVEPSSKEKERVKMILVEVQQDQLATKKITEDLINEILKNGYDFKATYSRYKELNVTNPLEKHGMSMTAFDELLDKYTDDPDIRALVASVVSPADTNHNVTTKLTLEQVMGVHKLMLEELERISSEIKQIDSSQKSDMKSVIIAVQALIFASVKKKYGISAEDLEASVMENSVALQVNSDFTRISFEISKTMSDLVGASGTTAPGGMFPG